VFYGLRLIDRYAGGDQEEQKSVSPSTRGETSMEAQRRTMSQNNLRKLVASEWVTLDGVFDADTMKEWFEPNDSDERRNYIREDFLVHPIIMGSGKRFFKDGMVTTKLNPVKTQTLNFGVLRDCYQPAKSQAKAAQT
jgi:hypothetical protein